MGKKSKKKAKAKPHYEKPSEVAVEAAVAAAVEALSITKKEDELDDDSDIWCPRPMPDCPLCMVPMQCSDLSLMSVQPCCGKEICASCSDKHVGMSIARDVKSKRQKEHANLSNDAFLSLPLSLFVNEIRCPFCREISPQNDEEHLALTRKGVERNDPMSLLRMAFDYQRGGHGLPRDSSMALALFLRSAELGSPYACVRLAEIYGRGQLGAKKDKAKLRYYLELGVKRGGFGESCRINLGVHEKEEGNLDLAVKHWRIAAAAGNQRALDVIKSQYEDGHVSKDEFAETLRAFQKAHNEGRSVERDNYAAIRNARA